MKNILCCILFLFSILSCTHKGSSYTITQADDNNITINKSGSFTLYLSSDLSNQSILLSHGQESLALNYDENTHTYSLRKGNDIRNFRELTFDSNLNQIKTAWIINKKTALETKGNPITSSHTGIIEKDLKTLKISKPTIEIYSRAKLLSYYSESYPITYTVVSFNPKFVSKEGYRDFLTNKGFYQFEKEIPDTVWVKYIDLVDNKTVKRSGFWTDSRFVWNSEN